MVLNLNNKGEFCGPQIYTNDDYITIRHTSLNPSIAWIKTRRSNDKYISRDSFGNGAYLTSDFKSAIHCKYLGQIYGKFCSETKLRIVDGFALMETSKCEKDSNQHQLFDYHLPSNSKNYNERDNIKCASDHNVGTWLRNVEHDPWISLDQKHVSVTQ